MSISDTIQRMQDGLPDPIPDLLSHDQAAIVQSCVISLKELARERRWKFIMKHTAVTTTRGFKTLSEYIDTTDDLDCMASTAHDLVLFKQKLLFFA